MSFSKFPVPVRPDLVEALRKEWVLLSSPGTWWTAGERVAIAGAARGIAVDGLPAVAAQAACKIYADITSTSRDWVNEVTASDLTMPAFIEIVGIASRLAAVDEFMRALGSSLEELPQPLPGDPSRETPPTARPGRGWVPMAGPASITMALSLVPAEALAQKEIHGPLYMSYEQMSDYGFRRTLDRAQMELIAARVSAINECFY